MSRLVLVGVGLLADLLELLPSYLVRPPSSLLPVSDVGLMMLVVVELERLGRHVRGERVISVGEFGELEGHGDLRSLIIACGWGSGDQCDRLRRVRVQAE